MDSILRTAQKNGITEAKNWREYVKGVADEYGVDFDTAWTIFDLLGPSEAFDGFVTTIEDMS